MRILGFLAASTIVTFAISKGVAGRYGGYVGKRFFERDISYTADSLTQWITTHGMDAAYYAFPVLFPVDLLFMMFFAAFLAFGSVLAAEAVPRLQFVAPWFAALPALYLAVDLAEDTLFATLLISPGAVNLARVATLQTLTTVKIWTVSIAGVQTLALLAIAFVPASVKKAFG